MKTLALLFLLAALSACGGGDDEPIEACTPPTHENIVRMDGVMPAGGYCPRQLENAPNVPNESKPV